MLPHGVSSSFHTEFWILAVGDVKISSTSAVPAIPGSEIRPVKDIPIVNGKPSPESIQSQYPWAIVSDATGSQLFVLARDADIFAQRYDSIVQQKIQDLGFIESSITKCTKIEQGAQCTYPM